MDKEKTTKKSAEKNYKQKTYALPTDTIAKIEVMAERTGKNRNTVITEAVQLFIEDYIREERKKLSFDNIPKEGDAGKDHD